MAHLKVINVSRCPIHEYENLKGKLYNCNANIYFNQQCRHKKLIPNYAKIKYLQIHLLQNTRNEKHDFENQNARWILYQYIYIYIQFYNLHYTASSIHTCDLMIVQNRGRNMSPQINKIPKTLVVFWLI